MSNISLSEITLFILNLEDKYNLFNFKIGDVYFWKLVRIRVCQSIFGKINTLNNLNNKTSWKAMIKKVFLREFGRLVTSSFRNNHPKDILVFQDRNKTFVDNKYVDVYTYYLINEMRKNSMLIEIYDLDFIDFQYHIKYKYKVANYSYFSEINNIIFNKIKYSDDTFELIKKIEDDIYMTYNIKVDLGKIIKSYLHKYIVSYKYYYRLFLMKKPKEIYITNSYGKEALIAAAHDNNILVTELQHGLISKVHLGYNFPNNKTIPYFPDKIMLFGKYWNDVVSLPLNEKNIVIYGYPHLKTQVLKYKGILKDRNRVFFISQFTVGYNLSKIAYEFALNRHEFTVVYKLHPGEIENWRENYPILCEAVKLNNFSVIDDNKQDLHKLLAESSFQVGVYSTVLFEGIAMDLKTILVDLPGIDHIDYLVKRKIYPIVTNATELYNQIINMDKYDFNKDYFFADI